MNAEKSFESLSFFSSGNGIRILGWKKWEFNVVIPSEEKKCSSSPLSERRITYRTVMLHLGGHAYLHFCLNWQRQCRQLKHNNPRQCQAGGLSASGTCHRNRFGAALHWSHADRLLCVNPSKEVLRWMLNPNLQKCKDVCLEIERVERLDWILVEGHSTTVIKQHTIQ